MQRRWWLPLVIMLALTGCSRREQTVSTPDGRVTVSQDGPKAEAKGPEGETKSERQEGKSTTTHTHKEGRMTKVEIGEKVDMSAMGVPAYPGATLSDKNSQGKVEGGGAATYAMGLKTKDTPERVLEWYKQKITVQTSTSMPEGGALFGTNAAGDSVTITAVREGEETVIAIAVQKRQ